MKNELNLSKRCHFTTDRLVVRSWKSQLQSPEKLAREIIQIFTPKVTDSLPDGWRDIDTVDKALKWIKDREAESDVLSIEKDKNIIGFLVLNEDSSKEVKLGYLLSEKFWGKGLGSELIQGLVKWCLDDGHVDTLSGGVDEGNIASKRVLEKNGFKISRQKNADPNSINMELKINNVHT